MKLSLMVDTEVEGDLSNAYKVLNALKQTAKDGPTQAGTTSAPAAPTPNAPPAPAPGPAAGATPPAPAPAAPSPASPPAPASPSSPAPTPAAAAPAAPQPPAPANGGITQAQFGAQVQAFAKQYGAKACKARFGELAQAFGQPAWDKTSAIPADKYADVMPWFATA